MDYGQFVSGGEVCSRDENLDREWQCVGFRSLLGCDVRVVVD